MKITNLNTGFHGNSQFGKTVKGSEHTPDYKPAYRKASGGEDFLEISDEALKRHKEARILSFEDGRLKKEVREIEVMIAETVLPDNTKAGRIKDMISSNNYDFNDGKILKEAAERVIAFIG